MHGIYHDVYIDASPDQIFDAVTSEAGLKYLVDGRLQCRATSRRKILLPL